MLISFSSPGVFYHGYTLPIISGAIPVKVREVFFGAIEYPIQ